KKAFFKLFLICLVILNIFLVSADNLSLDLKTTADYKQDYFILQKNITKELIFNSKFNLDNCYNCKVVYSYNVFFDNSLNYNNLQDLEIQLSKSEILFNNYFNSNLVVFIRPKSELSSLITLEINAKVFDNSNNLIANSSKYIKLIFEKTMQNSNTSFENYNQFYSGYSFDKPIAIIMDMYDKDKIKLNIYSTQYFTYDINCYTQKKDENYILYDINYNTGKADNFEIIISLDVNKDVNAFESNLYCYAFNKDNRYEFKAIKIKYLNKEVDPDAENNILSQMYLKTNTDIKSTKFIIIIIVAIVGIIVLWALFNS
ncbi:MAG: hypothetical protein V1824_03590, partial [archaeon]